jgi:hypothetical protein
MNGARFRCKQSWSGKTEEKHDKAETGCILYGARYESDRLCGLVVRPLGYRSGGPSSIPGTTRFFGKKKKENK